MKRKRKGTIIRRGFFRLVGPRKQDDPTAEQLKTQQQERHSDELQRAWHDALFQRLL